MEITKGGRVRIIKGEHKGKWATALSVPLRSTGYRLLVKVDGVPMAQSYDAKNVEADQSTEGRECQGNHG